MFLKYTKIFPLILIIFSLVSLTFAIDKLSPQSSPSSTFHSLSDIYNLILNNSTSTPSSSISISSSPTSTTSYSTSEIYALLANLVKQENLKTGITILGVTGNYGTPNPNYATVTSVSSVLHPTEEPGVQGYTLENIYNLITNNSTTTAGSHSFASIPEPSMHTTTEIYDALVSLSTNLSSSTIRTGVSYLGKTGIYNLGGSCTTNEDCPTLFCGSNETHDVSICTNGETGTDYCTVGSGCYTGYCDSHNGYCKESGADGTSCGVNEDCNSNNCSINTCAPATSPLADGLIAYWSFDNISGTTTVPDNSSNGNNGTMYGDTHTDANGKIGDALVLDGSGDYVSMLKYPDYTDELTWSMWFKLNNLTSRQFLISTKRGALELRPDLNQMSAYVDVSGYRTAFATWGADTNWHHVSVTFNDNGGNITNTSIYYDGFLVKNANISYGLTQTNNYKEIGKWGSSYFNGFVDEVAIWNRALSEDEILELYNSGAGINLNL